MQFALDDDWVEIDADTYIDQEDEYGTTVIGRVYAELPIEHGMVEVRYYGLFAPEED